MEKCILDELHTLNSKLSKNKEALVASELAKKSFLKNLINTAPFKKFEPVSYKDKDYEIIDVDIVERGPGIPDTLEMEIVYTIQRVHSNWDITTVFERDVKYMTKR